MSTLLHKNQPWDWINAQKNSFETLKAELTKKPTLAIVEPTAKMEVHKDASQQDVGGILIQRNNMSELRPVGY